MKMSIEVAFGTWKLAPENAANVILAAIQTGYRHIDTAASYANEAAIGDGIILAKLPRDALFVSGKLWTTKRAYTAAIKACKRSLKSLQLEYLDQYLIHWPASPALYENWREMNAETWRALEDLQKDGIVRDIGVCNFKPCHIEALTKDAATPPSVNQIECHPGWFPKETIDYCQINGIRVEAWSPLGNGALLTHPLLMQIASAHERSVPQICLRWCIQHDAEPITKTVSPERMRDNLAVFDFELTDDEMAQLDGLPQYGYSGLDPDTLTQFQ